MKSCHHGEPDDRCEECRREMNPQNQDSFEIVIKFVSDFAGYNGFCPCCSCDMDPVIHFVAPFGPWVCIGGTEDLVCVQCGNRNAPQLMVVLNAFYADQENGDRAADAATGGVVSLPNLPQGKRMKQLSLTLEGHS